MGEVIIVVVTQVLIPMMDFIAARQATRVQILMVATITVKQAIPVQIFMAGIITVKLDTIAQIIIIQVVLNEELLFTEFYTVISNNITSQIIDLIQVLE